MRVILLSTIQRRGKSADEPDLNGYRCQRGADEPDLNGYRCQHPPIVPVKGDESLSCRQRKNGFVFTERKMTRGFPELPKGLVVQNADGGARKLTRWHAR